MTSVCLNDIIDTFGVDQVIILLIYFILKQRIFSLFTDYAVLTFVTTFVCYPSDSRQAGPVQGHRHQHARPVRELPQEQGPGVHLAHEGAPGGDADAGAAQAQLDCPGRGEDRVIVPTPAAV